MVTLGVFTWLLLTRKKSVSVIYGQNVLSANLKLSSLYYHLSVIIIVFSVV